MNKSVSFAVKKAVFTLAIAGFAILPSISSAQSVSDLQAQIAALLAQVKQLQQQLAQVQGGGGTQWCHTFSTNLRVGDTGDESEALRIALSKEGFQTSVDDNTFNEAIASAVTGFQEKYKNEILTPNGLTNGTGYVGGATRRKLNQLYGCGSQVAPQQITVTSPSTGSVFTPGQAITIAWNGIYAGATYRLAYNTPQGSGDVATHTEVQCDGTKCYTTWTAPDIINNNIRITVTDVTNSRYGTSGTFGILSSSTGNTSNHPVSISWSNGTGNVQIGLVDSRYQQDGTVLGWIQTTNNPSGSLSWGGNGVSDFMGTNTWAVSNLSQGPFRILAVTANANGGYCAAIATNCNTVLSDYFNLSSPISITLPPFASNSQVSTSTTATGLTVSLDNSSPADSQLVMGSIGNQLAAFRFTNTSNAEDIKITDINIRDSARLSDSFPNVSNVKASFQNLQFWSGSTNVGTASILGNDLISYLYTVHFATPVIVPKGNSVVLTLKGDISIFASGGTTDNSIHLFSVNQVTAIGASSNAVVVVPTFQYSVANNMTVLRTKLTVSATPLGAATGRISSVADDLGTITFSADPAGSLGLNSVRITFGGSGVSAGNFFNVSDISNSANGTCSNCYVVLYDPATAISYYPTGSSWNSLRFDLNNYTVSGGSSKSFTLRINTTKTGVIAAVPNAADLSAKINSASDVVYTDAVSGGTSGLNLSANAVPININSVSYAVGTGTATSCTIPGGTIPVGGTTLSNLWWKVVNSDGSSNCYSAPFYCNSNGTLVPGLQFSPMPPQPTVGQALYPDQASCNGTTATTPAITIISPKGGETFTAGNTYSIQWNASNFPSNTAVYLELRPGPGFTNYVQPSRIALAVPSLGNYSWTIPSNTTAGQYFVEVYKSDLSGNINPNESVKSISAAPFTINAPNVVTGPAITVTSPNGALTIGQSYGISWTGGDNNVDVYLLDSPTRLGRKIFSGIQNNHSVTWTVSPLTSSDLLSPVTGNYGTPSGQYVIWVGCTDNNCTVGNSNSFNMVSSQAQTSAPVITINGNSTDQQMNLNTTYGGTMNLTWSVTPTTGTTCAAAGNWVGGTSISSGNTWTTPALYVTTTYGIACQNSAGTSYKYLTVNVPPQASAAAPTFNFIASPSAITYGQWSALLITSTSNGTSCSIPSIGWNSGNQITGSVGVNPGQTTTYTATCMGPGGSTSHDATVTVTSVAPTISPNSFTFSAQAGGANPASQNLTISPSLPVGWQVSWSCSSGNCGWLTANPTGAPMTGEVLMPNISGFAAGTYSGSLTIFDASASAYRQIPVTLTISSAASTATSCSVPGGTIPVGSNTSSNLWWKINGNCYSASFYCNNSGTLVPGLQFSPMPPQPTPGQALYPDQASCNAAAEQQIPDSTKQTANILQSMAAILQNMLNSLR